MRTLTILLFSLIQGYSFAQEHETVLDAPGNWQKEIIPFPIDFAPEIDLEGFEDLRFAPGWSDSTSEEFWTYMFVWCVEESGPLTEEGLTKYFNSYYDGLNRIEERNKMDTTGRHQFEKSISIFIASNHGFQGKIRLYDGFFTKKYFTLNINVHLLECDKQKKQIIRCELSPLPFDHKVWQIFKEVKLNGKC